MNKNKLSSADLEAVIAWAIEAHRFNPETGERIEEDPQLERAAIEVLVAASIDGGMWKVEKTATEIVVMRKLEAGGWEETRLPRQLPYRRPS